jgi:hypothetical protein
MALKIVLPVTLVIALAGCGSFGAIGLPWKREKADVVQPLPATTSTVGSVQSSDIGAPGTDGNVDSVGGLPVDTGANPSDQPLAPPTGTDTAMTAPSGTAGSGGLGRTDLLGGWTITAGNDSCQLFMTLTSWTGGYRASTKGCATPLLKSISAWNLQGTNVILAGAGGAPVATLASSGTNRFDGQANGQSVTFYR